MPNEKIIYYNKSNLINNTNKSIGQTYGLTQNRIIRTELSDPDDENDNEETVQQIEETPVTENNARLLHISVVFVGIVLFNPIYTIFGAIDIWKYYIEKSIFDSLVWIYIVPIMVLSLFAPILTFNKSRYLIIKLSMAMYLIIIFAMFGMLGIFMRFFNGVDNFHPETTNELTKAFVIFFCISSICISFNQIVILGFLGMNFHNYIKALLTGSALSGVIKYFSILLLSKFISKNSKIGALFAAGFYDLLFTVALALPIYVFEDIEVNNNPNAPSDRPSIFYMLFQKNFKINKKIKLPTFIIFVTSHTTFLLYLKVIKAIIPANETLKSQWGDTIFFMLIAFYALGCYSTQRQKEFFYRKLTKKDVTIWIIIRHIFISVLILIWLSQKNIFGQKYNYINTQIDLLCFISVAIIAFTFGLICSQIYTFSVGKFESLEDKERAVYLITFYLYLGIFLAFIFIKVLNF